WRMFTPGNASSRPAYGGAASGAHCNRAAAVATNPAAAGAGTARSAADGVHFRQPAAILAGGPGGRVRGAAALDPGEQRRPLFQVAPHLVWLELVDAEPELRGVRVGLAVAQHREVRNLQRVEEAHQAALGHRAAA